MNDHQTRLVANISSSQSNSHPVSFLNIGSDRTCRTLYAFKDNIHSCGDTVLPEKFPGFKIIIYFYFTGPTDLLEHSESPVDESRWLTSTVFILELPTKKKRVTTALTITQTETKHQHAHKLRIKKIKET